MENNQRYNTGLRRIGAAIVDGLVFIPILIIDFLILQSADSEITIFIWITIRTFLSCSYPVWFHYNFGQTLGKMSVSVKVIDKSEAKEITLRQALLRDCVYLVLTILGYLYFAFQLFLVDIETNNALENFDNFGESIFGYWLLAELITMLLNKRKRAIHDIIARTVVIREDTQPTTNSSN